MQADMQNNTDTQTHEQTEYLRQSVLYYCASTLTDDNPAVSGGLKWRRELTELHW